MQNKTNALIFMPKPEAPSRSVYERHYILGLSVSDILEIIKSIPEEYHKECSVYCDPITDPLLEYNKLLSDEEYQKKYEEYELQMKKYEQWKKNREYQEYLIAKKRVEEYELTINNNKLDYNDPNRNDPNLWGKDS